MEDALAIFVPSGVALLIAVGHQVWHGVRQGKQRAWREKVKTEQLLQEKAEQYCLASRNLMESYQEFMTTALLGREALLMQTSQRILADGNVVILLESFQLAFMQSTIGTTSRETSELLNRLREFSEKLGTYGGQGVRELVTTGALQADFKSLEQLLLKTRAAIMQLLDKIPNLDLYKLYTDWRKEHPIE